jgi:phosphoribosylglycinamide formyltransferase-1
MRVAVLASGRGSNLQALLDEWQEGFLPVELWVSVQIISKHRLSSELSRPGLRPELSPGVLPDKLAQEEDILNWLEEMGVELLILAGYMRVLSAYFIRKAECLIVKYHPSLLPAFPGLNAQQQALAYGVKVSGCTVHFVDEGMDTGLLFCRRRCRSSKKTPWKHYPRGFYRLNMRFTRKPSG